MQPLREKYYAALMEFDKFDKQLRLMVMLTQNSTLKVEEISSRLNLSRRSIYRYLDGFRAMGFVVIKSGSKYRIDHSSPFFKEITQLIHFTDDEAITINRVLNSVLDNSPEVRHLRQKLSSLYDIEALAKHGIDDHIARNLNKLYEAVKEKRVVLLRDYLSPNSGRITDRYVEPYLFLSNNSEVRCFEISTGMNKTFKISRARSVEVLDMIWSNEAQHTPFYTDLFHFSGTERFRVKMLLGRLATSLLLEEFPASEQQIELQDDGRYLLDTLVCSYKGVGRFFLGLYDDIEIVDSPEFQNYMNLRIKDLTKKIKK